MRRRLILLIAAASVLTPALAHAQPLGTAQPLDLHLARLVGGLLVCSLIAVAAAVYVKRFSSGRGGLSKPWLARKSERMTIIEARRLSVHADVCRFSCDGREYLVVVSAGGATLLRESEHPNAAEAGS